MRLKIESNNPMVENDYWEKVQTSKSLDFILGLNNNDESIFYNKIDINNIEIAGHSQGGVGTIHALYNFDNSNRYKAAYTASATTETMIQFWKLTEFEYDISKVEVPIFMVAGLGEIDGKTISPLADMKNNFEKTNGSAIIARRKNTDHMEFILVSTYDENGEKMERIQS